MKAFFLLLGIVCIAGCSNPVNYDPSPIPPDGIEEEMFASIRNQIDSLEQSPKSEWKSATGYAEEIISLEALQELTKDVGFEDHERLQLTKDFVKADSVVHFAFDCNYHALVFFDASNVPFRVEKW